MRNTFISNVKLQPVEMWVVVEVVADSSRDFVQERKIGGGGGGGGKKWNHSSILREEL